MISRLQGKFNYKSYTKIAFNLTKFEQITFPIIYFKIMMDSRNCEFHMGFFCGVLLKGQWVNVRLFRRATLTDLFSILEEDDDHDVSTPIIDVAIMPPNNFCDMLTDEDSGDEDGMDVNNLPPSQLRAEAEFFYQNSDDDLEKKRWRRLRTRL